MQPRQNTEFSYFSIQKYVKRNENQTWSITIQDSTECLHAQWTGKSGKTELCNLSKG
jgi:hypothetical protein